MDPRAVVTTRPRPPALAERLLRWSLALRDRPIILGDVEEEFAEIAGHDPVAAARWYWQQTRTSVRPNLARRVRQAWRAARRVEGPDDLERRRLIRKIGCWMAGVPLGLGLLTSAATREVKFVAIGTPLIILGLVFVAASAFGQGRGSRGSPRRDLVFKMFLRVWLGLALMNEVLGEPSAPVDRLLFHFFVPTLAVIAVWPDQIWPLRERVRVIEHSVRTPVVTGYRGAGELLYGTTTVTDEPFAMSLPILGCEPPPVLPADAVVPDLTPMKATIRRRFSSTETLRLFAAVNANADDTRASLEIRRVPDGDLALATAGRFTRDPAEAVLAASSVDGHAVRR